MKSIFLQLTPNLANTHVTLNTHARRQAQMRRMHGGSRAGVVVFSA